MKLAKKENVDIRLHTVIYEVTNEIKEAMEHKLEPKYEEVSKGRIEVRDTFHLPRGKIIAGSFVTDGSISRKDMMLSYLPAE
jgi:translation initiation factor IF-2